MLLSAAVYCCLAITATILYDLRKITTVPFLTLCLAILGVSVKKIISLLHLQCHMSLLQSCRANDRCTSPVMVDVQPR